MTTAQRPPADTRRPLSDTWTHARERLAAALLATAALAGAQAPPPYLRNGGFEAVAAGAPAAWSQFREAFADTAAPGLARSGASSVRSAFLFGWSQAVALPSGPYQHVAVAGWAAREFAFDQARTRFAYRDAGGSYFSESNSNSPIATASVAPPGATPQPYGPFWTTHRVPEDATEAEVYLGGRGPQAWLRFDDVTFYTEQLQTSGSRIGEGWRLAPGAPPGSALNPATGEPALAPGGMASQRTAVGLDGEGTFVSGHFAASPAPALGAALTTLTVAEAWLPRDADEGATATSSAAVAVAAGSSADFACDLGRPVGDAQGSGMGQVVLAVEPSGVPSGGGVALSDLSRGWAKAEPRILMLGPNSPDRGLQFTAAWPDRLTTATFVILTAAGTTVAQPGASLLGTTARAEWDGGAEPAGTYRARFTLGAASGRIVTVDRPFDLSRTAPGAPAAAPAFRRAAFTRAAWLFARYFDTTVQLDDAVRLARADGFDFLMLILRPDQFAAGRAAAEREGLPYVVQSDEQRALTARYAARDFFSAADYTSRTRALHSPFAGSPLWQGVYVADEPGGALLDATARATLALAQADAAGDGAGRAFSTLTTGLTPASAVAVAPPVVLLDYYPFHTDLPKADADAVLDSIAVLNPYVHAAAAAGRDLWHVDQAFEAVEGGGGFRPVPTAAHRASLAASVLAGARGVMPFSYSSISYIEGLRGPDLEPTRKLAAYAEFNALMERIGPTVMALGTPDPDARAPRPFAASVAQGPDAASCLMLLNADPVATRTLAVTLADGQAPPAAGGAGGPADLIRRSELRLDADGRVLVALGPGDWALVPLGSTASVAGYAEVTPAIPPSNPPLLAFDVPWTFTATTPGGAPLPVSGLSFDPAGGRLAASVASFEYGPAPSRVWRLPAGAPAAQEPAPLRYPSEGRRFLPDGSLATLSPYLGLRAYPAGGLGGPPSTEFVGASGGAADAAQAGPDWWLTLGSYGIRRLAAAPGGAAGLGLDPLERGASETGAPYAGLNVSATGTPSPSRVGAVVADVGFDAISAGGLDELAHSRIDAVRTDARAALSPDGRRIAMARHQRGVTLAEVDPTTLIPTTTPATLAGIDITDASACAWIGNDLLAVAAGAERVLVLRLARGQSSASTIGVWQPTAGIAYVRALEASPGSAWLAAGLQDGRVFVADVRSLTRNAARGDWQLYE